MSRIKVGMAPPHPGAFIRDEILDELHSGLSEAADALGVGRATLMRGLAGEIDVKRYHPASEPR